jgi:hypothetical protein
MKQRYKTSDPEHRQYRDFYMYLQLNSRILNSGQDTQPNILTPYWTKANLESELLTLVGNDQGLFKRESQTSQAYIPAAKMELEAIEKQFKRYCKTKVLEGREKPEEYPKEMLTRKLKAEAKLDVTLAEKEWIEKKLSLIKDKEEIIDQEEILKYGPVASGSFHGLGTPYYNPQRAVAKLDGQRLHLTPETESSDGFVIILDNRSPYSGMRTSDYYKMAKQWKIDRVLKEQLRFKKLKEQCIAQHLEVPTHSAFRSASVVAIKDLPPWPDWAKKYDQNGREEGATVQMNRTK